MSNKKSSILLFLTGCIRPDNMGLTKLQDQEVRKKQYLEAIKYYWSKTDSNILFVENSGYDLSDDLPDEVATGRLEILTFNGNGYQKELGKGYGEMKIIAHALGHSRLMKQHDFIFKITGRLKLLNLKTYLDQCLQLPQAEVVVDLRQDITVADSRCWGATRAFYEQKLLKYQEDINDSEGSYFEHVLCYACLEVIQCRQKLVLFKSIPRFAGVSGTDNTSYKKSFLYRLLHNILYKMRYIGMRYT